MAQEISFCAHRWDEARRFLWCKTTRRLICALSACTAALIGAASTLAQNAQQQFVYASVPVTTATSEVAGFVKGGAPVREWHGTRGVAAASTDVDRKLKNNPGPAIVRR